jgi:hypothetical protein
VSSSVAGAALWWTMLRTPPPVTHEREANDAPGQANRVAGGTTVTGYFGRRRSPTEPDVDHFRWDRRGPGVITIRLRAVPNVDAVLVVRDEAGVVVSVDELGPGGDERIFARRLSGPIAIEVGQLMTGVQVDAVGPVAHHRIEGASGDAVDARAAVEVGHHRRAVERRVDHQRHRRDRRGQGRIAGVDAAGHPIAGPALGRPRAHQDHRALGGALGGRRDHRGRVGQLVGAALVAGGQPGSVAGAREGRDHHRTGVEHPHGRAVDDRGAPRRQPGDRRAVSRKGLGLARHRDREPARIDHRAQGRGQLGLGGAHAADGHDHLDLGRRQGRAQPRLGDPAGLGDRRQA